MTGESTVVKAAVTTATVSKAATTTVSKAATTTVSNAATTTVTQSATTTPQNSTPNLVADLLTSWPLKMLMNFIPYGSDIEDVVSVIVSYIEDIEQVATAQGQGVAKKSVVVSATYDYIMQKFPALNDLGFIGQYAVKWALNGIVDFIVSMKNKYGWSWIPIAN